MLRYNDRSWRTGIHRHCMLNTQTLAHEIELNRENWSYSFTYAERKTTLICVTDRNVLLTPYCWSSEGNRPPEWYLQADGLMTLWTSVHESMIAVLRSVYTIWTLEQMFQEKIGGEGFWEVRWKIEYYNFCIFWICCMLCHKCKIIIFNFPRNFPTNPSPFEYFACICNTSLMQNYNLQSPLISQK